MKIKICAGWDSSENITKRLLSQFMSRTDSLQGIEFVYDDSYDIIIYNNYVNEQPKPNSKAYIFFHEPTWSGSHQKNFDNIPNITIFGFDKNLYSPHDKVIESIACTFYGGRGSWIDETADWNYDSIMNSINIKTKNISSVITTLDGSGIKDTTCTYQTRFNVVKHLLDAKIDCIDFYGGWSGYDNCIEKPQKIHAVKNYRFCLSIENQFIKNWITEKFYDCILYDTIPIYYGCQNIKDIYPENGYILIEDIGDFDGIQKLLLNISNNSSAIYNNMLPELQKIKQKYFEQNNLLSRIKSISKG